MYFDLTLIVCVMYIFVILVVFGVNMAVKNQKNVERNHGNFQTNQTEQNTTKTQFTKTFVYWLDIFDYIQHCKFQHVICNTNAVFKDDEYIEPVLPLILIELAKTCDFTVVDNVSHITYDECVLLINFENGIQYENNWHQYWGKSEIIGQYNDFFIIPNRESHGNKQHLLYIHPSYKNVEHILKYDFLKYRAVQEIMDLIQHLLDQYGYCLFNYITKSSIRNSFHIQVYSGERGIRPQYFDKPELYKEWKSLYGFKVLKYELEYKIVRPNAIKIVEFTDLLSFFMHSIPRRGGIYFTPAIWYVIGQQSYRII